MALKELRMTGNCSYFRPTCSSESSDLDNCVMGFFGITSACTGAWGFTSLKANTCKIKLEQLERLRSEIPATASWLPTVLSSDSLQIPGQNKTKSKLQILKNWQKFKFWKFARNFTCMVFFSLVMILCGRCDQNGCGRFGSQKFCGRSECGGFLKCWRFNWVWQIFV